MAKPSKREDILTRSCCSLPKMVSRSDQQGARIGLKKLGGQLTLKVLCSGEPILLKSAGSAS
jgi:hypothetical protein